jgi:hypothetical protein
VTKRDRPKEEHYGLELDPETVDDLEPSAEDEDAVRGGTARTWLASCSCIHCATK